jgi:hypothetical protein
VRCRSLIRSARSSTNPKLPAWDAASFSICAGAALTLVKFRAAPTIWEPCAARGGAVSTPSPRDTRDEDRLTVQIHSGQNLFCC